MQEPPSDMLPPAHPVQKGFRQEELEDLINALKQEGVTNVRQAAELIGMDVSRARRAEVIDEHAAIFILQGALDRLKTLRGER